MAFSMPFSAPYPTKFSQTITLLFSSSALQYRKDDLLPHIPLNSSLDTHEHTSLFLKHHFLRPSRSQYISQRQLPHPHKHQHSSRLPKQTSAACNLQYRIPSSRSHRKMAMQRQMRSKTGTIEIRRQGISTILQKNVMKWKVSQAEAGKTLVRLDLELKFKSAVVDGMFSMMESWVAETVVERFAELVKVSEAKRQRTGSGAVLAASNSPPPARKRDREKLVLHLLLGNRKLLSKVTKI